jgi:hypothetical protein
MIERRQHLCLAREPRHTVGVSREPFRNYFDGDIAAQLGVRGAVDFTHAAGAEWGGDFVWAESSPAGKWHRVE